MATIHPLEIAHLDTQEGASLGLDISALPAYQQELLALTSGPLRPSDRVRAMIDIGHHPVSEGVEVYERLFVMKDGMTYPTASFYPSERNRRSDIPINATTPYGTGIKGHNSINARRIAQELGYVVHLIGPEGESENEGALPWQIARRIFATGTLAYSATNQAAILNHIDLHDSSTLPGIDIGIGESRAADVQMAKMARDWRLGRYTVYADLTAAPFPERQLSIKGLWKAGKGTVGELMALPRVISEVKREYSQELIEEYAQSGLHSARYVMYAALGTLPAFLSGSASYLDEMREDQAIFMRVFGKDGWSKAEVWEEEFKGMPNAYLETVRGPHCRHMDLLSPKSHTFRNMFTRLAVFRDVLTEKPLNEIKFVETMVKATPEIAEEYLKEAIPRQAAL